MSCRHDKCIAIRFENREKCWNIFVKYNRAKFGSKNGSGVNRGRQLGAYHLIERRRCDVGTPESNSLQVPLRFSSAVL